MIKATKAAFQIPSSHDLRIAPEQTLPSVLLANGSVEEAEPKLDRSCSTICPVRAETDKRSD